MKLDKVNQWLSLVVNLGVVAGIVFVAVEVRQNNQMAVLQREALSDERVNPLDFDCSGRGYSRWLRATGWIPEVVWSRRSGKLSQP